MHTKTIDGKAYARLLTGGAAMLALHMEELNALNVFPVADGDTGTNMRKTLEGGLSATNAETEEINQLSQQFARGILLGARGNSGVILSQIFSGIHDVLKEHATADAAVLAQAYTQGIAKSYAAVQNPTEGTILTVFRESAEYAAQNITEASTVEDFFQLHVAEAKRSLNRTPELLPVLAEAQVVDSGAAGYVYIAEGMYRALLGEEITYTPAEHKDSPAENIDLFTRDSVLEFGYCTEFLLRLTTAKVDPDSFEIAPVIAMLQEMGGESIVAYKQDDIVKVHVHTFHPGQIMEKMQSFGEFLTVKIENMNLGHTDNEKKPKKPQKEFAVVTVAQGAGLCALFQEMGADQIVAGGQSSNPSIEDFVEAFQKCDAKNILVLPNNKNVILAAEQAAQLYTDAVIHVIGTKNIAQGYSALSVITPGIKDVEALVASAERAAAGVIDGEITRAVRDAVIDGIQITAGDYMSLSAGKILAVSPDPETAVLAMLEKADVDLCEIITVFVGSDVTDEKRAALTEQLKEIYDEYEITVYEGGQEIYDYLIAVE